MTTLTQIRPVKLEDSDEIARIYNHYIANTAVTFEVDEVTASEIERRIKSIQQDSFPWLVAQSDGVITGYAYAGKWQSRCAYRFCAESTVYLSHEHTSQGLGSRLYDELLHLLKLKNFHTVIAGISLPNDASVALHEKFGFKKVAHYREVGFKLDRWIDVGHWQLILSETL